MKRKKIILYIMLGLLVIIAGAALYIYSEYNRTHKDTARLKPDFTFNAGELIKEFETDEASSGKKYWDKVIRVIGMVKDIFKDERGNYSVSLGDTLSMSSVRCSIDSTHNNEAAQVLRGNHITVKGICAGFSADELLGSDVILVRCVIDKEK